MSGTKTIRGAITGAAIVFAATAAAPAAAIDPSYSGSWYTDGEAGSGYNLEIFSDERALLFWYTYNEQGEPLWLYSEGVIDGNAIDFDVYYSDGMTFSNPDGSQRHQRGWGKLLMEFSGCNNATISYDSTHTGEENAPEGTRELPVQRLVNIADLPCRQEMAGYWQGEHMDMTIPDMFGDLRGVTTQDGRLFFMSEESDEVFIGTYGMVGDRFEFDYEICPRGEDFCYPAEGWAQPGEFARRDFVSGWGASTQYGTMPFRMSYRTLYDRDVALASLAGTWELDEEGVVTTVIVAADGAVTGSSTQGCTYAGRISTIDANFDVFDFQGTVSGCTTQTWSGVVVNTDALEGAGDRAVLELYVDTGTGGTAVSLYRGG